VKKSRGLRLVSADAYPRATQYLLAPSIMIVIPNAAAESGRMRDLTLRLDDHERKQDSHKLHAPRFRAARLHT